MTAFLDDLTPAQRRAATSMGPVLVIAGAGTGKTKTLTAAVAYRIAARGFAPERVLAATFTNKAAGEMTRRIRVVLGGEAAPRWAGTFHGLAARQLRIEPEAAALRPNFDILDADDSRRIIKRIMKAMNLASDEGGTGSNHNPVKLIANRIGRWKDELVTPEEAPGAAKELIARARATGSVIDAPSIHAAARVYAEYQQRLREGNSADFGDLLLWPTRAMVHDRAYRARWAARFDCVLADEYQDVNRAQYLWLTLFAETHKEIFVVGDDDQSIFSWRGARIEYIRRFTEDFPAASVHRLEENFRSTGHILDAANAVIARDHQRLGKTLYTQKSDGAPIEVVSFRTDEAEVQGIVTEIVRRRAEGAAWDDIAILYRSNSFSRRFEEALMHTRVPYTLVGDVGFYQRAEIKDALALLRLTATPDDRQADEALRRMINTPPRGFGPKAMTILEEEAAFRDIPLLRAIGSAPLPPKARKNGLALVESVRHVAAQTSASIADQLSQILDASGYRQMLRESRAETTEDRLDNIEELVQLAGEFPSARDLLDHAALATASPTELAAGAVKLMTMHRAKGLEFGHVFLPGWENGMFPSSYGSFSEERRLAYVALTRGMRRVTISHCEQRRGPATPSCFIGDIPSEHRVNGWLPKPGQTNAQPHYTTPLRARVGTESRGPRRWVTP